MTTFRDFSNAPEAVKLLYFQQRANNTIPYVNAMKRKYQSRTKVNISFQEAFALLDKVVDISDPDVEIPNATHAFQSAEAAHLDGAPDWMIAAALIHDMGKIFALLDDAADEEGTTLATQWGLVGDTFILGHPLPPTLPFPDYAYTVNEAIYHPGCGLDSTIVTWGHDEILYQALLKMKQAGTCKLPDEALYCIRFHSLYAHHTNQEYDHLLDVKDLELLASLQQLNKYDLYSKTAQRRPYYQWLDAFKPILKTYFPPFFISI